MTNTTSPISSTPTDMHDMVVVHRVFRRELRSIPELIRDVHAGDLERASVVAAHARLIVSGLHLHHTGEDELLWPLLLQRATPDTEVVVRMQGQHEDVDAAIQRLTPALQRWEVEARPAVANEVAGLFDRLGDLAVEHLDEEEAAILPLAAMVITPEEWEAVGKAGVAKMSRAELPLMFGCLMEDASAEERQQMLHNLPLPVRVLMRTWGVGHYRRYITKVRNER